MSSDMSAACKSVILVAGAAAFAVGSPRALAQFDLYSNGSVSPSIPALGATPATASGVVAPGGLWWSETSSASESESNAVGGFSSHATGLTGAYRFADDFTITDEGGWTVRTIAFFAYQTGASSLTSPFSAINVRIWSGRPGDAGSVVVAGDTTSNRLLTSASEGVFRVFNSVVAPIPAVPDTTRLIWRTTAGMGGVHLEPGTYWVDWQYATTNPAEEAFSPPVTILGARGALGANARQFKINGSSTTGVWVAAMDGGKPVSAADVAQDFPFVIRGNAGGACVADFNSDGLTNSQDFFDFMTAFFASEPSADVNHDEFINSQDYFDFVTAFFAGC